MTLRFPKIDQFTLDHLDAWLDRAAFDDERGVLRELMLAEIADDPTLSDMGWPMVREVAERRAGLVERGR